MLIVVNRMHEPFIIIASGIFAPLTGSFSSRPAKVLNTKLIVE
jgi:hypothetical protein